MVQQRKNNLKLNKNFRINVKGNGSNFLRLKESTDLLTNKKRMQHFYTSLPRQPHHADHLFVTGDESTDSSQGSKQEEHYLASRSVEEAFLKCMNSLRLSKRSLGHRYFSTLDNGVELEATQQYIRHNDGRPAENNAKILEAGGVPKSWETRVDDGDSADYCRIPAPPTTPHCKWLTLRLNHLRQHFKKRMCPFCYMTSHTRHACPSLRCSICGTENHCLGRCAALRVVCTFCFCLGHLADKCPVMYVNESVRANSINPIYHEKIKSQTRFGKCKGKKIKRLNSMRGTTCILCCKTGHSCCASKKSASQDHELYCSHCGHSGHDVILCRKRKKLQFMHSKDKLYPNLGRSELEMSKAYKTTRLGIETYSNLNTRCDTAFKSNAFNGLLLTRTLSKAKLQKELKRNGKPNKAKKRRLSAKR